MTAKMHKTSQERRSKCQRVVLSLSLIAISALTKTVRNYFIDHFQTMKLKIFIGMNDYNLIFHHNLCY